MISISAVTAFSLYLSVTMAILFGAWLFYYMRHGQRKIHTTDKRLLVCEYCNYVYLLDRSKSITKCSQCGSLNNTAYSKREK